MARAIGLEIKKCLMAKSEESPAGNTTEEKPECKAEKMDVKEEEKPGSSC